VLALGLAACGGSSGSSTQAQARGQARGSAEPAPGPNSIVQIGDSIASGEGTLYGYAWDATKQAWTGGDLNVKWPDPYPDCHVSGDEYGKKVAAEYKASFAQFACTGASFEVGVKAPMVVGKVTRRPAEFGDWTAGTNLNADYDKANPDLVLVTLGADDVDFSDVIEDCIKNSYKHYWYSAKLECVPSNPGSSVQTHVLNYIPSLKANYATLVKWIQERAKKNDVTAPKILFTTYPNPFPDTTANCDDAKWLYPEQNAYLSSLLTQMNGTIVSSITGLKDKTVGVVDLEKAYQPGGVDHRWCSKDPWAYGLGIYSFYHPSSFNSQAPFHPTPDGQKSIAGFVKPAVDALFKQS